MTHHNWVLISSIVCFLVAAYILYMDKSFKKWLMEFEDCEFPDFNDKPSIKETHNKKMAAYDAIVKNLESCRTNEQLSCVYNMLEAFKHEYGKCDVYCALYADYVAALYNYTERNSKS